MKTIDIMYATLIFCLSTIVISCEHLSKEKKEAQNKNEYTVPAQIAKRGVDSTNDFLNELKKAKSSYFFGGLQAISAPLDSTSYFAFWECYDVSNTYRVIFSYKGGVSKRKAMGYDQITDKFRDGFNNDFMNFDCFVFVYPMRDPDTQKDVHESNVTYPVWVKVYDRDSEQEWHFKDSVKVFNLKQLSALEFKTIYGLPN